MRSKLWSLVFLCLAVFALSGCQSVKKVIRAPIDWINPRDAMERDPNLPEMKLPPVNTNRWVVPELK